MSTKLSIAEVLAKLEARVAFHEQREAHHTQQEGIHREQRESHAADLAQARRNLESFRAISAEALDFVQQGDGAPPEPPVDPLIGVSQSSGRVVPSRLVRAIVGSRKDGEPFGATDVAREVNRRFRDKLRRPMSSRAVGDTLRRMEAQRLIHLVRPGRAKYEALFKQGPRPKAGEGGAAG
jgi:hypothetical protein